MNTSFIGADMRAANAARANLRGAKRFGANLGMANLEGNFAGKKTGCLDGFEAEAAGVTGS
jgi:uncharacterized protein YjbI with pentapeptide repeats